MDTLWYFYTFTSCDYLNKRGFVQLKHSLVFVAACLHWLLSMSFLAMVACLGQQRPPFDNGVYYQGQSRTTVPSQD